MVIMDLPAKLVSYRYCWLLTLSNMVQINKMATAKMQTRGLKMVDDWMYPPYISVPPHSVFDWLTMVFYLNQSHQYVNHVWWIYSSIYPYKCQSTNQWVTSRMLHPLFIQSMVWTCKLTVPCCVKCPANRCWPKVPLQLQNEPANSFILSGV